MMPPCGFLRPVLCLMTIVRDYFSVQCRHFHFCIIFHTLLHGLAVTVYSTGLCLQIFEFSIVVSSADNNVREVPKLDMMHVFPGTPQGAVLTVTNTCALFSLALKQSLISVSLFLSLPLLLSVHVFSKSFSCLELLGLSSSNVHQCMYVYI